ncbi:patatin-like phospholipase family protein [Fertoebacter nigrum]|uniref:Patatin-like phospholipase family protein n=1 Tax=Fertoeibacter niger TaxID=2656921 RepID=A0A8X8GYE0_9RHOB|nr:patatin-like phospholipase family protein [Fertoeibacter niger]NUB46593.1 patatin-like phospholipase family protein [Fertoeibacter niger]
MKDSPPTHRCDLVMKGGITSGVVYPRAVVGLSRKYRFENIGGTSAGAIAAAVTAAAEYGRASGGFTRVAALPQDLSKTLLEKFQPTPQLAPLFRLALAGLSGKPTAILRALLTGYPVAAAGAALPGAVIMVLAAAPHKPADWGFLVLGGLLVLAGLLIGPLLAARKQATRDLPEQDYGLCTGLTQPGYSGPALTDWLSATIDDVAGLGRGKGPLTIGQLRAEGINVQTVTTDITTHRPYALPMGNNLHAFHEDEFRRLFPGHVVDHMIACSSKVADEWGDASGKLHYFQSDDLPVVVLARMSLSFPGLISAVPLHRIDYTLVRLDGARKIRRCLFSDGGISSNFPVHFFDRFLPQTPTFGIALSEYDIARAKPGEEDQRITLPTTPDSAGRLLPTRPFGGLAGFVMAMFDSAKDWQDSLQAVLTGYRERIATVALKADEGGLNLQMPPETICRLTEFGEQAGRTFVEEFDLKEHRWRRFLTELPLIEDLLIEYARHWDSPEPGPGDLSYPALLDDAANRKAYALRTATHRKALLLRAERLAALGRALSADPMTASLAQALPLRRARLRVVANMDDEASRPATANNNSAQP